MVCEHGLVCKTHPQPMFSTGGMKLSVVHHVLIKSSNTDAKPCIQNFQKNMHVGHEEPSQNSEVWALNSGAV